MSPAKVSDKTTDAQDAASETNHGPRYDRWVAATTRPLDLLAVVFLVVFILGRLVPDGPAWFQTTLTAISFTVWAAFAIDYVVRLSLANVRSTFIRNHKLDLVMVLLPMLRLLRVILLLRKSFKTVSTERIASSLISIVVVVVVSGAFLEWGAEHNAPGANITTLGTALWWSIVTTTTVGYGDTYPITPAGRVIGSVIMMVGIGLIGTVSATVAAWFVNHKREREDAAKGAVAVAPDPGVDVDHLVDTSPSVASTLATLTAQIELLTHQQTELRATIDRLAEQRSPS